MPITPVIYFRAGDGSAPLLEWLVTLEWKVQAKCLAHLARLESFGHSLRRPSADYLRDGIYELRVRHGRVNYRMLYFFHFRDAVVVSHGFRKQEARVDTHEIETALTRKALYEANPSAHTFEPES